MDYEVVGVILVLKSHRLESYEDENVAEYKEIIVSCVYVQSIGARIIHRVKEVYEMNLNGDFRVKVYSIANLLPRSPSWSRIPHSAK